MIDERTIDELKSGLTSYVQQITTPSRNGGRNMYICPLCKSGTGKHKSGAFSITSDGQAWKCFSCNQGGDIFKLIELHEHITEFPEQLKRAAEVTGARIDPEPQKTKKDPAKGQYKEYIAKCHADAGKTNYFISRGFNDEVIERFNLGYDESKEAIVIPYDGAGSYYITRSTTGKQFRKPKSDEAGEEPIYNLAAIYADNKPCFITESPLDAISIITASGGKCSAAALGGTGHRKLINALEKRKPNGVIILSFDADKAGSDAAERAAAELAEMGIIYTIAEYDLEKYPEESRKDPNDFLRANFEQLQKDINANIEMARQAERAPLEKNKASNHLKALLANSSAARAFIETGFNCFDKEMDGGLYPGLYILGAISSMGKTSLMLQIADQIAAQGNNVLYFTLEMGAQELIARSLSRYSYIAAGRSDADAVTARSVASGAIFNNYQRINIEKAKERYTDEIANNLWYFESLGEIGIDEIKAEIEKQYNILGTAPTVFIDYLQILKPYNEAWTEKRNTDKAVTELRKLARDYNITIFAISSLNRGSYKGDIEMDAFKESGAIEYGSDVLLALQTPGLESGLTPKEAKANKETIENEKRKAARELELKILKNRSGSTGQRIRFTYNAKYNYFAESEIDNMPGWEPYSDADMTF